MNRRNALLGFTVAAAPLLVRSTTALGQATSPNPGDPLDPASYALQTLQVGTLTLETSQLALQISTNPFVRRFAKLEVDEQTAIAKSLTNNFNPPPASLTADQQQAIQSLQGLSGTDFDTAYVQAQIQGHRQLLFIQQDFLAGDTDITSDFVHVALIASAFIETHLTVLRGLAVIAPV